MTCNSARGSESGRSVTTTEEEGLCWCGTGSAVVVVVEDGDKFDDQGRCQNAVFGSIRMNVLPENQK